MLHHSHPPDGYKALLQALVTLASASTSTDSGVVTEVEMGWMDSLPEEDATTLYSCNELWAMTVCARSLVAECFEQRQGRQGQRAVDAYVRLSSSQ